MEGVDMKPASGSGDNGKSETEKAGSDSDEEKHQPSEDHSEKEDSAQKSIDEMSAEEKIHHPESGQKNLNPEPESAVSQEKNTQSEQTENENSDYSSEKPSLFRRYVSSIWAMRITAIVLIICLVFSLGFLYSRDQSLTEVKSEANRLESSLVDSQSQIKDLLEQSQGLPYDPKELKNSGTVQLLAMQNAAAAKNWTMVENLFESFPELYLKSDQGKQASLLYQQALKENGGKKTDQGSEASVSFEDLARTPDKFIGSRVTFTGNVIQIQGKDELQIRLAVNGDYSQVVLAVGQPGLVRKKLLKNDWISISGTAAGSYTYQSVGGTGVTVPLILADKIELKK